MILQGHPTPSLCPSSPSKINIGKKKERNQLLLSQTRVKRRMDYRHRGSVPWSHPLSHTSRLQELEQGIDAVCIWKNQEKQRGAASRSSPPCIKSLPASQVHGSAPTPVTPVRPLSPLLMGAGDRCTLCFLFPLFPGPTASVPCSVADCPSRPGPSLDLMQESGG